MKKNNLVSNKGLSLSQAQSISNLCNQRAAKINMELTSVNNFEKKVKIVSIGTSIEDKVLKKGIKIQTNVVDLLNEMSELYACQAFLMENIKAKDILLKNVRAEQADTSGIEIPERPKYETFQPIEMVNENFGWEQLSAAELNEYIQAEAYASHIGQYIHKDGHLSKLRDELPEIPELEWLELETGKKTPVDLNVHHTADQLLSIHEELAAIHRQHEQRVNYFKAKVKNLTTKENARIAKENADKQASIDEINSNLRNEYETAMIEYNKNVRYIVNEFEKTRQDAITTIASMRIDVDSRFQPIVDKFLKDITKDNVDSQE